MERNPDGTFFYPVKLVVGVLYPDENLWRWTAGKLSGLWGAPEDMSPEFPFTVTDYYSDISPVLFRRFLSFSGLRDGGELPEWKRTACRLENESGAQRTVNIDPGYVNGARLVLASTKDNAHRVYIGGGIHGEVTLRFRFKKWEPFDYTFPDFAEGLYDGFLSVVRKKWIREMESRRREK
ncbi:DUF4416 family protein [Aminivibrio sp.]|jgi:hypothetical protein|uniref:DUF4416 family protein n=1 Tax=Aminivibrio sp. TaxID=1872489 RepID=UPI001A4AF47F|nr:DUF4416 family protein [Aminivibrio sp.]MBL3538613.1 DUF4416 family protein [Aminivibrio sp.]